MTGRDNVLVYDQMQDNGLKGLPCCDTYSPLAWGLIYRMRTGESHHHLFSCELQRVLKLHYRVEDWKPVSATGVSP